MAYCFTGSNTRLTVSCERFVPADNEWYELPDAPCSFNYGTATTVNAKIYIASFAQVVEFDPVSQNFPNLHNFAAKSFGKWCAAANSCLYVFDGVGPTLKFDQLGNLTE
jgi:hypothetical protein